MGKSLFSMDWRSRANGTSVVLRGRAERWQTYARQARESHLRAVALDEPVALERRQRALEPRRAIAPAAPRPRPARRRRGRAPSGRSPRSARAWPRARRRARSRTRPRDGHHGAAGQPSQRGARAVQKTRAELHRGLVPVGVAARAAAAPAGSARSRAATRRTFVSTAATGSPNANDATAAAVYGPTPGSARSPRRRAASRRARRSRPPRAGAARGGCSRARPTP